MSGSSPHDPRHDPAAVTDEGLLDAHEKAASDKHDAGATFRPLPLTLLFVFSGLIFFAGTYLNSYSGRFDARVYDETGGPPKPGVLSSKADPRKVGQKLFNNAACNTCHQTTGQGVPGVYPPLAGSEWVQGSEERLIRIVLFGLQGPVKVKGTDYPGTAPMPSFGKVAGSGYNWSDDKIAAVLTYVRSEWGNTAGPIAPEQVAAIRSKEGDRKAYTQEELLKLP